MRSFANELAPVRSNNAPAIQRAGLRRITSLIESATKLITLPAVLGPLEPLPVKAWIIQFSSFYIAGKKAHRLSTRTNFSTRRAEIATIFANHRICAAIAAFTAIHRA